MRGGDARGVTGGDRQADPLADVGSGERVRVAGRARDARASRRSSPGTAATGRRTSSACCRSTCRSPPGAPCPRARTPVNDGAFVFVARVVVPPPAPPVPAATTAVVDDCDGRRARSVPGRDRDRERRAHVDGRDDVRRRRRSRDRRAGGARRVAAAPLVRVGERRRAGPRPHGRGERLPRRGRAGDGRPRHIHRRRALDRRRQRRRPPSPCRPSSSPSPRSAAACRCRPRARCRRARSHQGCWRSRSRPDCSAATGSCG